MLPKPPTAAPTPHICPHQSLLTTNRAVLPVAVLGPINPFTSGAVQLLGLFSGSTMKPDVCPLTPL